MHDDSGKWRNVTGHLLPGDDSRHVITAHDHTKTAGGAPAAYDIHIDSKYYTTLEFVALDKSGLTHEQLITIIVDRLSQFQLGEFRCRENALAITKLQEALHWLQDRTADRIRRGVERTLER